jgi:putative FmdB family regulatory protein
MPIYAYRCGACGHALDVLQKLSDPVLTTCPSCGAEAFSKQVTAAGFQLKGSGWYATDFRDGNKGSKGAEKTGEQDGQKGGDKVDKGEPAKATPDSSSDAKGKDAKGKDTNAVPTASPASAPAPAAAPTSGGSSSSSSSS